MVVLHVRLIRRPLSHSRPSTADVVESAASNDRIKAVQLHHRPWRPADGLGCEQEAEKLLKSLRSIPSRSSATFK